MRIAPQNLKAFLASCLLLASGWFTSCHGAIVVTTITTASEIVNTGGTVILAENFGSGQSTTTLNGILHGASNSAITGGADFSGPFGGWAGDASLSPLLGQVAGKLHPASLEIAIGGLTIGQLYLFQAYWMIKDDFGIRTLDVTFEGETLNGISGNSSTANARLLSLQFTATDTTFNGTLQGNGNIDNNAWLQGVSMQAIPEPSAAALCALSAVMLMRRRRTD